ncbi:MAG TPA: hypothetical protein PLR22_10045, partial [Saprospiraceae bacterium]|nr:hypothetical protein [Saprospiraceae bacterium]
FVLANLSKNRFIRLSGRNNLPEGGGGLERYQCRPTNHSLSYPSIHGMPGLLTGSQRAALHRWGY